jgi:hypothetical protein
VSKRSLCRAECCENDVVCRKVEGVSDQDQQQVQGCVSVEAAKWARIIRVFLKKICSKCGKGVCA